MGLTILIGNPRPVDHEGNGQILNAHIVQRLIISPLQEGRIDKEEGFQAAGGHTGAQCNCVLFCDAHIVELLWMRLGKGSGSGAQRHRGGNNPNAFITVRQPDTLYHQGCGHISVYFILSSHSLQQRCLGILHRNLQLSAHADLRCLGIRRYSVHCAVTVKYHQAQYDQHRTEPFPFFHIFRLLIKTTPAQPKVISRF